MDNQTKNDLWQKFILIKDDKEKELFLNKYFNITIVLDTYTYNIIDSNNKKVLITYYKSMMGSKNQLYGQIFDFITNKDENN